MKIDCGTIEDFCREIAAGRSAGRLREHVVRVRVDRVPEQDERISFDVWFTATALVDLGGPLAVVEFRAPAGVDRADQEEGDGSLQAAAWYGAVRKLAADCDLAVRGGRLELA